MFLDEIDHDQTRRPYVTGMMVNRRMDDLDDPQHESRAETMNNWGFNLPIGDKLGSPSTNW